jgi:hypothetical protein
VEKNTLKPVISNGVAEHINLNIMEKCGGVAVKINIMQKDAKSINMFLKNLIKVFMMMKKKKI